MKPSSDQLDPHSALGRLMMRRAAPLPATQDVTKDDLVIVKQSGEDAVIESDFLEPKTAKLEPATPQPDPQPQPQWDISQISTDEIFTKAEVQNTTALIAPPARVKNSLIMRGILILIGFLAGFVTHVFMVSPQPIPLPAAVMPSAIPVSGMTATEQTALDILRTEALKNAWPEDYRLVELLKTPLKTANGAAIPPGSLIGTAYAKWPVGRCTRQNFIWQPMADGGFERFEPVSYGEVIEAACDKLPKQ